MTSASRLFAAWPWLVPLAAAILLATAAFVGVAGALMVIACVAALVGAVLSAVHHAEVVAHRIGEPFGTLVLAVAITVIEVALIVAMMRAGGPDKATLPRDTIFSALMIICNGLVGLCLLVGGLHHREQSFRVEGANTGVAALVALSTLSLVLPAFTTSTAGGTYSVAQLLFAAVASLALWAAYVFFQTVRHRDYFLPPGARADEDAHAPPPTARAAWTSFGLLLIALVAVVGLAKLLSPAIEGGLAAAGAPPAVLGIAIALLVLLPETWAAVRAARADRMQTSLNLAYGSALASIGLTIPAVAIASILLGQPLVLGLDPKDLVLLVLTFLTTTFTLVSGRTNLMQGAVHLVIFAAFLFLALVP
ncbi:calcium:proton antiporter [Aquabacterium humicola]|uniref:calcium:proton antiporter n=1 Tax=Aquabacterium humicola TaxID=3237377 RepID=UPI0025428B78|nr:ionic transporter y4hA [Rubrivivax pictus]